MEEINTGFYLLIILLINKAGEKLKWFFELKNSMQWKDYIRNEIRGKNGIKLLYVYNIFWEYPLL